MIIIIRILALLDNIEKIKCKQLEKSFSQYQSNITFKNVFEKRIKEFFFVDFAMSFKVCFPRVSRDSVLNLSTMTEYFKKVKFYLLSTMYIELKRIHSNLLFCHPFLFHPSIVVSRFCDILVFWYPGILVSWYLGILVSWYPGILVSWYPGILVSQYPSILVSWYPGILVFWYPGILVSWYPSILARTGFFQYCTA